MQIKLFILLLVPSIFQLSYTIQQPDIQATKQTNTIVQPRSHIRIHVPIEEWERLQEIIKVLDDSRPHILPTDSYENLQVIPRK